MLKEEKNDKVISVSELIERDKALRAQALSRQMAIHDAITNEKHAREDERNTIICSLFQKGVDEAFISSVVDLPVDEVRNILQAPPGQ